MTAEERRLAEEQISTLLRACGHRLYHSSPQSRTQARVLQSLQEGPVSQKELQERLGIQSGSMSELITKLETRGLLVRERDGCDRRKVLLRLTAEGRARSLHMQEHTQLPVRYDALTDGQAADLIGLLERVIESWKGDGAPENGPAARKQA